MKKGKLVKHIPWGFHGVRRKEDPDPDFGFGIIVEIDSKTSQEFPMVLVHYGNHLIDWYCPWELTEI